MQNKVLCTNVSVDEQGTLSTPNDNGLGKFLSVPVKMRSFTLPNGIYTWTLLKVFF